METPFPWPLVLQALARALRDEEGAQDNALTAVWVAGKRASELVPQLVELLQENECLATSVMAALEEMGPAAHQAVPFLRQRLLHEDMFVREGAATALVEIEPDPLLIPLLIDLLHEIDPADSCSTADAWYSVARALGKLGPAAEGAIPRLEKALYERYGRLGAAEVLATMGATAPLLRALQSDDPEARHHARVELGQEAPPEELLSVAVLIEQLGAPEEGKRVCAARQLRRWGEQALPAIPALIEALGGSEERYPARQALVAIGRPAVPALLQLLAHPDAERRFEAIAALDDLAEADELWPALEPALHDPSSEVRRMAMQALAQAGVQAIIPELLRALEDEELCGVAADALGKLGPAARVAVPRLFEMAREGDDTLESAVQALLELEEPPASVIAVLTERLRAGGEHFREVGDELGELLEKHPEQPIAELVAMLEIPDTQIRSGVIEALGQLRSRWEEALAPILQTLSDPDSEVRWFASLALTDLLWEQRWQESP
jgi:HEAT repeat protein